MRSDYILYSVAVICFIVLFYAYITPLYEVTTLYLYVLAVLGLAFAGLGYMSRPKKAVVSHSTVTSPEPPLHDLTPKQEPQSTIEQRKEVKKPQTTKKRAQKKRTTRKRKKKS